MDTALGLIQAGARGFISCRLPLLSQALLSQAFPGDWKQGNWDSEHLLASQAVASPALGRDASPT